MTEIYDRSNDSTDSFFNSYTLSVLSLRSENPNLQKIDETKKLTKKPTTSKTSSSSTRKPPPPITKSSTTRPTTTTTRPATKTSTHDLHRETSTSSSRSRPSSRYSFQASTSLLPSLTSSRTQESGDIKHLTKSLQNQNFWKYHIMLVGKHQFYLTTNPDIKHLYCRTGPGYFVQLILPRLPTGTATQAKRQSELGYRLIFKRQNYDELDNEENLKEPDECIVVTKASREEGGGISIVLSMINGLNGTTNENPQMIKNKADEKPIEELKELMKKDPRNTDLQKLLPTFHRYELKVGDESWYIGSNPIVKQRTSNKLKINSEVFKLTGKQNVYFFQKPKTLDEKSSKSSSKRHSLMKSLRHDSPSSSTSSQQLDEKIVALFRPHERRLKKKVIKALNSSSGGTTTAKPAMVDEYNYIENDQYYKPGDGLNQVNPKDDAPNEYKIGWITIFDEQISVEMWELVLGYTFAVGFDRLIDDYIRET